MAVQSVIKLAEVSGSKDNITVPYVVTFTDTCGTLEQALAATDGSTTVPVDGTQYGTTNLYSKADAKQDPDSINVWYVTVNYSKKNEGSKSGSSGSGGKWNKEISMKLIPIEKPVTKDSAGDEITMTNGKAPLEPATYTDYDIEYTITFQTDSGTYAAAIEACAGLTNSDTVGFTYKGYTKSFTAGKLRLTDYSWKASVINNTTGDVFDCSLTLLFRVNDVHYDVEIANKGTVNLNGQKLLDANGQPLTTPQWLDDNGEFCVTSGLATNPVKKMVKSRVAFTTLLSGI